METIRRCGDKSLWLLVVVRVACAIMPCPNSQATRIVSLLGRNSFSGDVHTHVNTHTFEHTYYLNTAGHDSSLPSSFLSVCEAKANIRCVTLISHTQSPSLSDHLMLSSKVRGSVLKLVPKYFNKFQCTVRILQTVC